MKKWEQKKNNATWIVMGGFLILFFICMLVMTYEVKQDMEEDYLTEVQEILEQSSRLIKGNAQELSDYNLLYDSNNRFTKEFKKKIKTIIKSFVNNTDQYLLIDIGVLDNNGNLLFNTMDEPLCYQEVYMNYGSYGMDSAAVNNLVCREINFYDYFSDDEIEDILFYYEKDKEERTQKNRRYYEYTIYYDEDIEKMVFFTVNEWEARPISNTSSYNSVKLKTVFQWISEEYIPPKTLDTQNIYEKISGNISSLFYYPHLKFGEANYEEWKNDEMIHNFMAEDSITHVSETYIVDVGVDVNYSVRINYRIHSWQAAFDSLKDLYVYSAIVMGLCLAIVLFFIKQIDKKREELVETRKDFTNAIAHEFKTPLAIVRGLVENMEEEESEEEKAFYQKAIVDQTELMDGLVQEMILISKLDSEKLHLQEESISVHSLMEEQMKKLKCPVMEKKLQVQYQRDEDFVIKGDRLYLAKAFFNLLENAVSYNKEKGTIWIHIDKNKCMIENTAEHILEEDLPHLCEMFFRGDKSRNTVGNHRGLGLYLTKRIFDMHDIKLKIENTDRGVRVTVF